ncbi:type II secretion system F family protein [Bifidobacterium leontopitheci]|uniref:Type II secretion protein F n=1 Tax=Bifidobacterium leontopitheci TaxID=2650774 RepID=A0A6I1GJY2_9BIFI|nr:type II secretion system F family protein [Bifidobacterium leontopitheci]KAB7789946.1 type II secretion protein F [Bifidobacterium leontopitheci]
MSWSIIAAAAAAACCLLCRGRGVAANMPDDDRRSAADARSGNASITLVLGLLMVSLRGGMSITGSLSSVGQAVGGRLGDGLQAVCDALHGGASWDEAWRSCDFGDRADVAVTIRDALEPSWRHGVSPSMRLSAALQQWDADARGRIEREAAALSVRLLLPTGLCFLPAFVFLGIIPTVATFATGG